MKYYKDTAGHLHALESAEFFYLLPDGCVEISDQEAVELSQPTADQVIAAVLTRRDELFAVAARAIAPLQDAIDLDEAVAEERSEWTAWKQYRVALNRIQQQPDYPSSIEWPVAPG